METIITSEQDLSNHEGPLPEDLSAYYFKMVGVGPNTLAEAGHLGSNVCDIVIGKPGFFAIGSNAQELRAAMHDLVDRFCDAQEK